MEKREIGLKDKEKRKFFLHQTILALEHVLSPMGHEKTTPFLRTARQILRSATGNFVSDLPSEWQWSANMDENRLENRKKHTPIRSCKKLFQSCFQLFFSCFQVVFKLFPTP